MSEIPRKKVNKAKARLQRRAEEMESQRREAAAEAASMPNLKAQELSQMNRELASLGLVEHDINADGHCLYSAFAHQLSSFSETVENYQSLRHRAAEYMRKHPEEFTPFLISDDAGAVSISTYTDELESTPRWGGELEIIALARDLRVTVIIIQANGKLLKFEEQNSKRVTMARYQHMYSLGAHFNSVKAA